MMFFLFHFENLFLSPFLISTHPQSEDANANEEIDDESESHMSLSNGTDNHSPLPLPSQRFSLFSLSLFLSLIIH